MSLRREKTLICLFGLAVALRLIMVKWTYVMSKDGIGYIAIAKAFFSGDLSIFMRENPYPSHPLYPILIGIAQKGMGDWELAGKMVSAIAGSLLIVPFYIWGKEKFGERAALFSTFFLALNPFHVRYSADVITEATYILFFFLGAIFSIEALFKKRLRHFFYAGLFVGLAYLSRPEGAVLVLPLAVGTLFSKSYSLSRKALAILVVLVSLSMISLPYMLYMRMQYGRWLVSAKYDIGKIAGLGFLSNVERSSDAGTGLEKKEPPHGGVIGNLNHLTYVGKRFAEAYHPLMALFLLYGIIARKLSFRTNKANIYLLIVIALYAAILFRIHAVYGWFSVRHILPVAVLGLYWAGMSFDRFVELSWKSGERRSEARISHRKKATAICLIIVLSIMAPKALWPQRADKMPEKRVGLWIKENYERQPVILTNMARVSFYAQGKDMRFPKGNYDDMVNYVREQRVDFIVVNEDVKRIYPDFFVKAKESKLSLVLKEGGEKEVKVLVYRIK